MKMYWMFILFFVAHILNPIDAKAQDDVADQVHFSLPLTSSLRSRGLLIVLLCERPDATRKPPGRYLGTDCFRIPQVGSEPIGAPVGFSFMGDRYPFGSTRFDHPLVFVYLTEKNEPITVYRNEEGSCYSAEMPGPWAEGSNRTLINFDDLGQGGPRDPMTAEVSGTMANRDILITLRGKKEAYSFTFDFDRIMRRWIQLPANSPTTAPAATQLSSATTRSAEDVDGDQIRVSLVNQQVIGKDAHLLTVMAEAPLPHARGRRKAFYYFVQNAADGTNLKFVTSKTSEDTQKIGSGPGNVPAAEPKGVFSGSMITWNAKLSLAIGSDMSQFKYDYSSGKWIEENP